MKARIGVMPENMIRERTLAVLKGEYTPEANEPKVWFTSLNAISQLLCDENRALLKLIKSERPETITELVEMTGRKKPNLSKTLNALANKGFVKLEKRGRTVKPVALFTEFEIVVVDDYRELSTECTSVEVAA
ncbi:helix-turn-helix domain-containing protein [Vibrio sp. HN007]|uniref:HVO_A0114 family putative DNA-binding protein n=1 Tax=Vibrio iocasae TaxID=3098914 RepID=UPI0035D4B8DA